MSDAFRRYLQTRITLADPALVFADLDRREARRLARRLAIRGPEGSVEDRPGEPAASSGREAPARRKGSDAGSPREEDVAGEGPGSGQPAGAGGGGSRTRSGAGRPEPTAEELAVGTGEPGIPEEEVERLSREGTAEEIGALEDLAALRAVVERCRRCPLHRVRQRAVFGEGDPDASVLCVGEAPGAREDETGRPFVGPAGQLMDRLLLSVGFRRNEVFICNVLKSRPPDNRDPEAEEIEACVPYLLRQIDLVDPDVIIAFGAFAARTLLDSTESLGRLRNQTHLFRGYPLVATYHPAALLRNRSWTRPSWEDLQLVRRIVEGEAGQEATEQLDLI